jgi:NAD(P)-dependent dehydrogenase (short-subunit alcohol dehydrogenase family)
LVIVVGLSLNVFIPLLPDKMSAPFPSPTVTWRNGTYPEIEPTWPDLSQSGKRVIIPGAVSRIYASISRKDAEKYQGSGIGRETALSFAKAGAQRLILIGRTETKLRETKAMVADDATETIIYAASVIDEDAMKKIVAAVRRWDVLILNAGYISPPGPLAEAPAYEYWMNCEVSFSPFFLFFFVAMTPYAR